MKTVDKVDRKAIEAALVARDGLACGFPDCNEPISLKIRSGPRGLTIDHWIPQHYGKANGWSREEIWGLDNLKFMHRKCNAKKGDRVPNADGTLPPKQESAFRPRRVKRASRPESCDTCYNGRILLVDEVCPDCDRTMQPASMPTAYQRSTKDCTHSGYESCWLCVLGLVERQPAFVQVLDGEFLDE